MRPFSHLARFAWRRHRLTLLIFLAGLAVSGWWFQPFSSRFRKEAWEQLDPVFSAATFFVAVVIWLGELRQTWEVGLPKKLNVYFVHDGWVVLACENAFLAGEDDLRAWGQQIGSQMNDGAHLKFGPFITPTPMPVARAPDGTWYKPYRIKFLLDMPPVARLQQAPPGVHLCLVWTEGQNGRKSVGFRENWSEEQFDAGKPPPPARFFPETG